MGQRGALMKGREEGMRQQQLYASSQCRSVGRDGGRGRDHVTVARVVIGKPNQVCNASLRLAAVHY